MAATLLLLFVFVSSSIAGSPISFCEDIHKRYLNLSNAGIHSLEQSFVLGVPIECLNLENNQLTRIVPEAFTCLPDLEYLKLSDNSINFEDFTQLRVFENLKTLILDKALTSDHVYDNYSPFGGNEYLRTNDYDYNDDRRMFFPKLEQLSMCNYLDVLPQNVLHALNMPSLTHLYLNGNNLQNVQNLPQIVLKNLTHLYLDNNELSAFSGSGLGRLRHLSLNQNKIQRLCVVYCNENAISLRDMPLLEDLSIVENSISMIDAYAFANSANLVTVDLSINKIKDIGKHAFENMTKLEYLMLDRNFLSHMPDICALVNLRTLSLIGNRITSIDETSFCNLSKLTDVNLRENHLMNVASGTFDYLPAIATIDLSWNNIASLPCDWMRSNVSLEELNLDGNFFKDIASMSLEKLDKVGCLSIGRNPFKTVTIGSLIGLPINTTLDFSYTDNHKDGASQQTQE